MRTALTSRSRTHCYNVKVLQNRFTREADCSSSSSQRMLSAARRHPDTRRSALRSRMTVPTALKTAGDALQTGPAELRAIVVRRRRGSPAQGARPRD